MQSKEDTKEKTTCTSESLLTMWGCRAVAKAPPFLFLHGGGSWWPRHSRFLRLYPHGRNRVHHGSMLNKAWETCDTKPNIMLALPLSLLIYLHIMRTVCCYVRPLELIHQEYPHTCINAMNACRS